MLWLGGSATLALLDAAFSSFTTASLENTHAPPRPTIRPPNHTHAPNSRSAPEAKLEMTPELKCALDEISKKAEMKMMMMNDLYNPFLLPHQQRCTAGEFPDTYGKGLQFTTSESEHNRHVGDHCTAAIACMWQLLEGYAVQGLQVTLACMQAAIKDKQESDEPLTEEEERILRARACFK